MDNQRFTPITELVFRVSFWTRIPGLELNPHFAFSLAFQGLAFAEPGRFKEALNNMQKAAQNDDNPTILALGAHVHAVAGLKGEAEKLTSHPRP